MHVIGVIVSAEATPIPSELVQNAPCTLVYGHAEVYITTSSTGHMMVTLDKTSYSKCNNNIVVHIHMGSSRDEAVYLPNCRCFERGNSRLVRLATGHTISDEFDLCSFLYDFIQSFEAS